MASPMSLRWASVFQWEEVTGWADMADMLNPSGMGLGSSIGLR